MTERSVCLTELAIVMVPFCAQCCSGMQAGVSEWMAVSTAGLRGEPFGPSLGFWSKLCH